MRIILLRLAIGGLTLWLGSASARAASACCAWQKEKPVHAALRRSADKPPKPFLWVVAAVVLVLGIALVGLAVGGPEVFLVALLLGVLLAVLVGLAFGGVFFRWKGKKKKPPAVIVVPPGPPPDRPVGPPPGRPVGPPPGPPPGSSQEGTRARPTNPRRPHKAAKESSSVTGSCGLIPTFALV
ncbi:MAG: hypothetical protein KatS3mg026_0605 [Bacteroidia bacterium]|nr:MAG: hypothetical protein KatS3mg026_0605 [Bacteroidia bacterium]